VIVQRSHSIRIAADFSGSFLPARQGRLALTAPNARYLREAADGRLEHVCQTAIDGRRAVRKLTQLSGRFEMSESELQILSCLSRSIGAGLDQTTLAASLAFSPPQVSACVEKLRTRGLIAHHEVPGDSAAALMAAVCGGNRDSTKGCECGW
jgi:hypothetical protein